MAVFPSVVLAGALPFRFPTFFVGDFVSELVDWINHDGSLRVFCNKGAGLTPGLGEVILSFLL